MTIDEQHKFYLDRPTPTTPLQLNLSQLRNGTPAWRDADNIDLRNYQRWSVRWKPEPKTEPAWPPVKPYWVRFNSKSIRSVDEYAHDYIIVTGCKYTVDELCKAEWTSNDFKTWHPFTKEVE